jgi:hypothetical protein
MDVVKELTRARGDAAWLSKQEMTGCSSSCWNPATSCSVPAVKLNGGNHAIQSGPSGWWCWRRRNLRRQAEMEEQMLQVASSLAERCFSKSLKHNSTSPIHGIRED